MQSWGKLYFPLIELIDLSTARKVNALLRLSFSFKGYALALILDQILQFSSLGWVGAQAFSSYHLQFCFRVLLKEKVGTISKV